MRPAKRMVSPEVALHASVDALGGLQAVGVELRPDYRYTPDSAGRWLSHCLDDDCRDKLSLRQVAHIFMEAHAKGEHEGFVLFAGLCGYVATPLQPDSVLADLHNKLKTVLDEAGGLTAELRARMTAAGLKLE